MAGSRVSALLIAVSLHHRLSFYPRRLEITRLSRWLRALVELGWNSPASEEAQHDTLEYLSLAQAIMKEPMDSAYPPDEMLWLLAKALSMVYCDLLYNR